MDTGTRHQLPQLSDFPPEQVNPTVRLLLEIIHEQQAQIHALREENQALRDEIARLKGGNPRPRIKPSKLEGGKPGEDQRKGQGRGKNKRSKTRHMQIHEDVVIPPQVEVPVNSRFKGYDDFVVQDLVIGSHNIRYRVERWVTPAGETLRGQLPASLDGGHFGPTLRAFVVYQYHHAHVTQPLLLEQLGEWGIEISAGQLSRLITEGHDAFHAEKDELLRAGLAGSDFIHVDDTGARHRGRNGYCTHIGNDFFAFFASTDSKSRINFLALLRAGDPRYVLNDQALAYMAHQQLPQALLEKLATLESSTMVGDAAWQGTLEGLVITNERHVRIATEGALLGAVLTTPINPDLVIISDDAGQFNVLIHALCWIHAERGIHKLVGFSPAQRAALAWVRDEIWAIYQALKDYRKTPSAAARAAIEARFQTLCTTKTCFAKLNEALVRLHRNGAELLRVLDYPQIALNNNLAERDIREYVKKRKISGSTRSQAGRRCRDTFASLKKTCRKQGISFWQYLLDRLKATESTPWLPDMIFGARGRAQPARGP
ncbi:MAG: transposase [Nitrococcus sp.]|nr:transposase [Nitrococcus sp.]